MLAVGMNILEDGWGGRIRTYEWQSQSLLTYRLSTPQSRTVTLKTSLLSVNGSCRNFAGKDLKTSLFEKALRPLSVDRTRVNSKKTGP